MIKQFCIKWRLDRLNSSSLPLWISMSRFFLGCTVFNLLVATATATNYSYFCQWKCGDKIENSCNTNGRCDVPKGCTFTALNTFTRNDGVCEGFLKSNPYCSAETTRCPEAQDFMLVWDRHKDFVRNYELQAWQSIASLFDPVGAFFVPGSNSFFLRKDVPAALQAFQNRESGLVKPLLEQALTVGGQVPNPNRTIHVTGSWSINETQKPDMPFYARWQQNKNGHWVMETLLVDLPTKFLELGSPNDDDLLKQISQRSIDFAKMYNAGNFSKLSDFYVDSACIVPQQDRPFEKPDIPSKKAFLGSDANLATKIVFQSPGSDAVHEIGFSSSTNAGYMTRWVKTKGEWLIESHVFSVFPKVGASEIIV